MKLTVERTGGFGGLKRHGERSGEELSVDQRAALDRIVKDHETGSSAGALPGAPENPGADQFTYRIEIEDENGTRSITLPDVKMPKELKGIVL